MTYVDYDPDLAAIGVIEPVFVDEKQVLITPTKGLVAHLTREGAPLEHAEYLTTERHIVYVTVLRWQRVEIETEPEWAERLDDPLWVGIFWTALAPVLALIISLAVTYL